ncbi:MAG: ATP-binding cassette domain-containing protein [Actinomyces graevenitzii]|nr:ATP-binding cassette domain-containing protein [Actinomyces graevenitzii]
MGSTHILHQVSLTVERGESVALLGANGCGKSTLIKACLGLYPLAGGDVRLFGASLSKRRQVPWMQVGYVPQRVSATAGVPATALEVVRSGLLGPGRPFASWGGGAKAQAMEALAQVGLAKRANDHVQVFSGGQAQRVMIARALVRRPQLLFLDEPLAGVDRASRQGLADCLAQLREQGITLVTVLHEMGELAGLVDRTVTLADGRVVASRSLVASRPLAAHEPEREPGRDQRRESGREPEPDCGPEPDCEPDCDHLDPHSAAPAYVHHHAPNLHLNQADLGGRHDH